MSEEDTSSSSDSDSSSDEEEEVSVDSGEVDRLEMQLRSQPFNFAFHEQYVTALCKAGKSRASELRTAREDMSKKFPLPEGIWLQWTKDEAQAANTPEEKEQVIQLYETALKDYQSVSLRVSFGAFVESSVFSSSKGGMPDTASIKRVRDVYEAGLTSVGLHMTEGHRVWAAYRTFEQRILSLMGKADSEKNKQLERIRSLYKRQLAVPHNSIQETYADYVSFEASQDPPGPNPDTVAPLQTQYKNALAAVEARAKFEEAVAGPMKPSDPDYSKVPAWREYLEFEESKGDPSRIQCLYERALKGFFLVADLWTLYVAFLEKTFSKMPQLSLPIYARAVRNCYWSGELWVANLRALELAQRPAEEIEGVFETGLVSGMQQETDFIALWDALIDYHRRRYTSSPKEDVAGQLRATMQRYMEYFVQYFAGSATIPKIRLHFARLESAVLKNITNARKLYGELIHHDNTDYHIWSEWIAAERAHAHDDQARQLYRRVAQVVALSDPPRARADWISFERAVGDIAQYRTAMAQCAVYDAEMYARAQAQALAQQQQAQEKRRATDRTKRKGDDGGREVRNKRQRGDEEPKRPRKEYRNAGAQEDVAMTDEKGEKGEKSAQPEAANNLVYFSNLPWKMHEPQIEEFFSKIGKPKAIRLVRQNGKSMGYAFVEFEDEKAANDALTLDNTDVQNRQVRVQLSTNAMPHPSRSYLARPPASAPSDNHESELTGHNEALTLFVSNLPFSCNKDDVIKALEPVREAIRDVRLAMDAKEGGRCRGFGYIELADSDSVTKALAISKPAVKGRSINIALAREKSVKPGGQRNFGNNSHKNESAAPADAEGEGQKPITRKGMAVPRALKLKMSTAPSGKKAAAKSAGENTNENKEETSGKESEKEKKGGDVEMGEGGEEAPKSNDFFKNLMKKK